MTTGYEEIFTYFVSMATSLYRHKGTFEAAEPRDPL